MSVDVEKLHQQAIRWGIRPCVQYSTDTAHRLLQALPTDPRVSLQWCAGGEWQFVFAGKLIHAGSFEDCVTILADGWSQRRDAHG